MRTLFFVLLMLIALELSVPGGPVFAQTSQSPAPQIVVPVDGKDPVDGSRLFGVRLAAESGKAFLFFLCDSDNTNPRIIFGHGEEIHAPTKPVGFEFTIDDAPPFKHYFAVLPNKRSAIFFVRTAAMYEDRFGVSPKVFDEASRAVNQNYIDWTNNVYNQVTADLMFGTLASVHFVDGAGNEHDYVFHLVQLAEQIGRLKSCYESPWVY